MGRIGRMVLRSALGGVVRDRLDPHQKTELKIAHINDLAEPAVLAHLLNFDSVQQGAAGRYRFYETSLKINGFRIPLSWQPGICHGDWVSSG